MHALCRCFVNGTATSLRVLREIGAAMVDVNGQNAAGSIRYVLTEQAVVNVVNVLTASRHWFACSLFCSLTSSVPPVGVQVGHIDCDKLLQQLHVYVSDNNMSVALHCPQKAATHASWTQLQQAN